MHNAKSVANLLAAVEYNELGKYLPITSMLFQIS